MLVDANVLLDVSTEDVQWLAWSADALSAAAADDDLVSNPIIYAEVSLADDSIEKPRPGAAAANPIAPALRGGVLRPKRHPAARCCSAAPG